MDYRLLDSGDLQKLEKWGSIILVRPDPQAIWKKFLPDSVWQKADAVFTKKWDFKKEVPKEWEIEVGGFKFKVGISSFKHTGVFPEHVTNWEWIMNKTRKGDKILNLFGYTGGATLAAAKAGAEVTHVDASKISIAKARENADLNGLKDAPIRWIVDDCSGFLKREIKRGNRYDAIILDPPSFGRGLKNEVWKIEKDLLSLLELCKQALVAQPAFILLNGYAEGYSKFSYSQALSSVFNLSLEKVEAGELVIREQGERSFSLPAGIYAKIKFNN